MTNTAHMCREGRGRFGWRWPEEKEGRRRGGNGGMQCVVRVCFNVSTMVHSSDSVRVCVCVCVCVCV